MLSVMGISFSFLPVAQQIIATLIACTCSGEMCTVGGSCASCTSPPEGNCLTTEQAYGKVSSTVCTSLENCCHKLVQRVHVAIRKVYGTPGLLISGCSFLLSTSHSKRIFPSIVTGTYLILLGISLVVSGFQQ